MIRNKDHRTARTSLMYMLALLFAFTLSPGSTVSAQETDADVRLPVMQRFTLKNAQQDSVDKKGTYEMTALDFDNPMPEGSTDGRYTFSLKGDKQAELAMTYDHGGVYRYQLRQTTKDAERYTYDRAVYIISVYINNGENGQLIPQVIVENEQKEKCENILFENTYTIKTVPATPGTPDKLTGNTDKTPVKTGDTTNAAVWITMLLIAFSGIVAILLLQRKSAHETKINLYHVTGRR